MSALAPQVRIGDVEARSLSDFDAPLSDRLGAVFDDAWVRSPFSTISRWIDRETTARERVGDLPGGAASRRRARRNDARPFASPLVEPDVLNERYADIGVSFSEATRESVAAIRAATRREELARQRVIARGDQGFGFQAKAFGVGMLATMADPLNIASAFVPVVGPARFAAMTARGGIHGARLARGAIEGVAGAALVEPIVLAGAYAEDADYGTVDSLINLAFGGVLGGGLHLAGGRLSDRLSRVSPEAREQIFRAAAGQAMDGRHIDIEPIVRAAEGERVTPEAARDFAQRQSAPEARALDDPEAAAEGARGFQRAQEEPAKMEKAIKEGPDAQRAADEAAGEARTAADEAETVRADAEKNAAKLQKQADRAQARAQKAQARVAEAKTERGRANRQAKADELKAEAETAQKEADKAVEDTAKATEDAEATAQAADEADALARDESTDLEAEADAQLDAARREGLITPEDEAELRMMDEQMLTADDGAKAVEAFARCRI